MASRGVAEGSAASKSGTAGRPFQAIVMSSARTPSATSSLRVTSLTATYGAPRLTRTATFDSMNQPNLARAGRRIDHCSRCTWCTSTTTRARVNSRARNGMPFCTSSTASRRPNRRVSSRSADQR